MKRTTTDEAPDLHERIKRWRVAKKLSQTQIAEGLGITVSAVSYWEGGGKKREEGEGGYEAFRHGPSPSPIFARNLPACPAQKRETPRRTGASSGSVKAAVLTSWRGRTSS